MIIFLPHGYELSNLNSKQIICEICCNLTTDRTLEKVVNM